MIVLKKYTSFIKLEHSLFSLPLFFSGAILATGAMPSLRTLLFILVAGSSARVVAMTLNRIVDRQIDKKNPRTQYRHLATGVMKLYEAWGVLVLALALYLWSAWSLSVFCLKLSWIPLVGFALYPTFKRFTKWTHLGLGLVWSLVPLGGFLATKATLEGVGPVLVIGIFCMFWLAGFDIIYATADEDFDRKEGLCSLPACWGLKRALRVASLFHFLAFLCLALLYGGWLSGNLSLMVLLAIGVFLFMEQKLSSWVHFAFFQTNVVIGFLVLILVMTGIKGV